MEFSWEFYSLVPRAVFKKLPFSPSSYSEKMRQGQGWGILWSIVEELFCRTHVHYFFSSKTGENQSVAQYWPFLMLNTVKRLNSGHLRFLKNLFVIEGCLVLGGNFKKIVTFGTQPFVRYSWHVHCLGCPLLGGFTVLLGL